MSSAKTAQRLIDLCIDRKLHGLLEMLQKLPAAAQPSVIKTMAEPWSKKKREKQAPITPLGPDARVSVCTGPFCTRVWDEREYPAITRCDSCGQLTPHGAERLGIYLGPPLRPVLRTRGDRFAKHSFTKTNEKEKRESGN